MNSDIQEVVINFNVDDDDEQPAPGLEENEGQLLLRIMIWSSLHWNGSELHLMK